METGEKKPSKFANLLLRHRNDATWSLKKMALSPWSTLATVFVIATALLLPACLLVLNNSLDSAVQDFRATARVTLYLRAQVTAEQGLEVSNNLQQREDVTSAEYISSQQALNEFSAATGLSGILSELGDNPLPATIVIQPRQADSALISQLAESVSQLPEAESVQVDESWIRRAEAIANAFGFLGQSLGLIFALGVTFIVANAVRMAVESRKPEIRVIKLVGGSDGFIARPLLYTGIWYGLCGSLLTAIVLVALVFGANHSLLQAGEAILPGLTLRGPGLVGLLGLLLVGSALGWLSARVASWHYIRAIDL